MRLIDEEALIEEAQTGGWDINIKELKMTLEYVPTIDAVLVVRCKDCKHYYTTGRLKGFGWCKNINRKTNDDFYCAYGEQLNKREVKQMTYEKVGRNIVTNADRIRSMNDEELAEYIFDLGNGSEYCYGHCAYQDDCATDIGLDHNTCIKGVIEWLKQPAKEV